MKEYEIEIIQKLEEIDDSKFEIVPLDIGMVFYFDSKSVLCNVSVK